jgi:phospholipase/carboxylesterase
VIARGLLVVALALGVASAYRLGSTQATDGKLAFTAHAPRDSIRPGVTRLGLADDRDGFLFIPRTNGPRNPAPLVVMLHGATQRARMFERLSSVADTLGVVILAPDSRDVTWDGIQGGFGPDVSFLDRAITRAFDRAHIDSCRLVLGGFSDGASYALSLGIRNGRRVHGVIALSPGFLIPTRSPERVPVFMRHGTRDQVLAIDRASRRLVRVLRDAGFAVDYEEFDGPHTVRPADARAALQWAGRRRCS